MSSLYRNGSASNASVLSTPPPIITESTLEVARQQKLTNIKLVERSDKLLTDNENQQNDCWRRIQELERTLQKLGSERFEEIKRRIDENEMEEKRKTDYQQLLDAAAQHRKLLELTLYNVDSMIRGIGLIEDLVSELGGAVKTRYNKCTVDAGDTRVGIHEEYLQAYTKMYRCIGSLIYKKEKKLEDLDRQIRAAHIQLEFSIETFDANAKKYSELKRALYEERARVEEEIQTLKDKLATAEELFTPTAEALKEAGVHFDHPADVVEQRNLNRRTKMVEYRTHIHKYQEMKLEREKERIRMAKEAIAQSPQHTQPLLRIADPYSPAPADYDQSLGLLPPPIGSPNHNAARDEWISHGIASIPAVHRPIPTPHEWWEWGWKWHGCRVPRRALAFGYGGANHLLYILGPPHSVAGLLRRRTATVGGFIRTQFERLACHV